MPLSLNFKGLVRTDGYSGPWQGYWTNQYQYDLTDPDHNPNTAGNWEDSFVEAGAPISTGGAGGSWLVIDPGTSVYPVLNPSYGASLILPRAPFRILELDKYGFGESNIAKAWCNITIGGLSIATHSITFGGQDGSSDFDIQLSVEEGGGHWGWRTTPEWGGLGNPFPPYSTDSSGSVGLAIAAVNADFRSVPIDTRGAMGTFEDGKQKMMDITNFVKGYVRRADEALLFEYFPINPNLSISYYDSWSEGTVKAVYGAQVEASISWQWHENIEGGVDYWLPYGTITQVGHTWETVTFGDMWAWLAGATLPDGSRIPPAYIPRQTPIA